MKALFTEKTAHRIIHGQFVNSRGAPGQKCANDLRMEMYSEGMCGNKTLKTVERCTQAAYGQKSILDTIDKESGVPKESSKHTQKGVYETVKEIIKILHRDPFKYTTGRTLVSFPNIKKTPLENVNVIALNNWITHHKKRLSKHIFATVSDDENDDDDIENTGDSQSDDNSSCDNST